MFWNSIPELTPIFPVTVYLVICESKLPLTCSCIVYFKWKIRLFSVAFNLPTTSFPWPGALIPRSIIILIDWDKIDNRCSAVTHLYCSLQPSVISQMIIDCALRNFIYLRNWMIFLLCAAVVVASCLLLSEKNWMKHSMPCGEGMW